MPSRWITVAAVLALSLGTRTLEAHPFHVSIADAEWNAEHGRLEVALQVHPEDLEAALRQRTTRPVELEKTAGVDKLVEEFIREVFRVTGPDQKPCPILWVGQETTPKETWIYFEIPAKKSGEGLVIANTLFFDQFADQVNLVNIKHDAGRTTLTFNRQRARQTVRYGQDGSGVVR
jgi:hypothetical protein